MKWGVKIPFEDSFLWVLDKDQQPILFDSVQEAEDLLVVWPAGKITEYKEMENES